MLIDSFWKDTQETAGLVTSGEENWKTDRGKLYLFFPLCGLKWLP